MTILQEQTTLLLGRPLNTLKRELVGQDLIVCYNIYSGKNFKGDGNGRHGDGTFSTLLLLVRR